MRRRSLLLILSLALIGGGLGGILYRQFTRAPVEGPDMPREVEPEVRRRERICLPFPRLDGEISLEKALRRRRSIREYEDAPITLRELSQILWASYGVTETRWSLKTTPSAGGTYPLDIYFVANPRGVITEEGSYLIPGSYIYEFETHCARLVREGELRDRLYRAALEQDWVRDAPLNIVIVGVFERTTKRYGNRGVRYVWLEAGHASQNIYLQATALGLGTVAVGAFYDEDVIEIIGAEKGSPLYIMPIGRPVRKYDITEESLRKYYEGNRARQ